MRYIYAHTYTHFLATSSSSAVASLVHHYVLFFYARHIHKHAVRTLTKPLNIFFFIFIALRLTPPLNNNILCENFLKRRNRVCVHEVTTIPIPCNFFPHKHRQSHEAFVRKISPQCLVLFPYFTHIRQNTHIHTKRQGRKKIHNNSHYHNHYDTPYRIKMCLHNPPSHKLK